MSRTVVQPKGWAAPKGYSNGVVAQGHFVFVAGQIGWDPTQPKPKLRRGFVAQFDQALANVVAVVRAAGGQPDDLTRMLCFVTDKRAYLKSLKAVGESWRRQVGRVFPAMALVEVSALVEDAALVELEAIAVLPARR